MAEVLGVVSGVVGITAFVAQVAEKIEALRATYNYNQIEAKPAIESLLLRLGALHSQLQTLQKLEGHQPVRIEILSCQASYVSIDLGLQKLLEKFSGMKNAKLKGSKSVKIGSLRDIRSDIENLESKINTMSITMIVPLLLLCIMRSETLVGPGGFRETHELSVNPTQPAVGERPLMKNLPAQYDNTAVCVSSRDSKLKRASCGLQHCHCSCHLTETIVGRYWGIQYTPLSVLFGKCDNKECTSRRPLWKLRFALSKYRIPMSKYRIPWAFIMGIEWVSGNGKYTLRPALSLERVVKYTSPGFEILWKCQNHEISLPEAEESFLKLFKSDPSLKTHVNPGGNGYVRELLCYGPWVSQDRQFGLLQFLISDIGMTLEDQDQSFLVRCATWIGEGRHLDLLNMILEYGFDPSMIDSPLFQKWPEPCSPGWRCEDRVPDPFFIEYLATLGKTCPGFAGATPLQDAILSQSVETVSRLLSSPRNLPRKLEEDRNFLGQTPLHLASADADISNLLLLAEHDIDALDNHGTTPLMYAAAMGNVQVVQRLIMGGASLSVLDTRLNRSFIAYASACGQWKLIFAALSTIRSNYAESIFQNYVKHALMCFLSKRSWLDDLSTSYFERLIELCEDVNLTFRDDHHGTSGMNLLHYVRNKNEAQALFESGFQSPNRPNSDGKTALYSIVQSSNAELFQYCLEKGIKANHVDHEGHTVLFHLVSQLGRLNWLTWDTVDSIKMCMAQGVDIFISDDCNCPCVLDGNGCHLSSAFDLGFRCRGFRDPPGFVWAFEWLSIVEELRGYEASKTMLLSFLRRMQADILDMKHVCCHGGRSLSPRDALLACLEPKLLSKEVIEEILDEGAELHGLLEKDMELWAKQSLKTLKSELMLLLKTRYDEMKKKVTEEPKPRKGLATPARGADYKNDCFVDNFTIVHFDDTSVVQPSRLMTDYAFWLQHEYFRGKAKNVIEAEERYKARMSWFRELMDVMQVRENDIIKGMCKVDISETRSENVDLKENIGRFLDFSGSPFSESLATTLRERDIGGMIV